MQYNVVFFYQQLVVHRTSGNFSTIEYCKLLTKHEMNKYYETIKFV